MLLTKGLAVLGATLAGSLLAGTLVATAAVAAPAATTVRSSPTATTEGSATTVRLQQQNVVVTSLTAASDTASATITVRDPKRSDAQTTWNVAPTVKVDGAYKRFSDIRVGFRVHLAGPVASDGAPTADHIVVPGSNKKLVRVDMRKVTVQSVTGPAAAPTSMTVETASGTFTWTLDRAKLQGGKRGDLSVGDVVSVRGERLDGASTGAAKTVKIDKNKKAKPAKKAKPVKKAKPAKK